MPIPFDMMAVMLFLGYYVETPAAPAPTPAWSAAIVALGAALLFLAGVLANRLLLRALAKGGGRRRRGIAAAADIGLRVALVAVYMLTLTRSGFPWSVGTALGWKVAAGSFAAQLLGLAPYVLQFFCAWLPLYGLHRATNSGVWTRFGFLIHKARYNLFMLFAWLPFALLADWLSEFLVLLPVLFLLAAWTFPFLLAKIWGCRPLADPALLETVRRLERRAGAGFSRVYLWEPGAGVQNAAAVGIFRPFRYLFLTPALIRNMDGAELEAVILHELGHVRKRHLLFYLATSMAGINASVLVGALLPLAGNVEQFVFTTGMVLAYFRLVFGWLSRNMERQADLFALERSGSARGLANALEKLGLSAGNIRNAGSWHHLGIAERVVFLRRAERTPELATRHNAAVAGLMLSGYLASLSVLAVMGWVMAAELGRENDPARGWHVAATDVADDVAHWRRVMRIMPGDPTPPLELAYRLAGNPGSRGEAVELAARAMRLSCGREERAAAAKLLDDLGESGLAAGDDGKACN